MAHKNEFLPFANNSTSNVIEQTSYESLDARKTGFASGVAKSAQLNKVWRQSSIMASALGQFIADKNGVDILDDGDVPKLVAEMNKAISGGGTAGVKTFNGASGDITISQGSNISITKNGNDFKIAATGDTGVKSLNNLSGDVKLVAGANVTITPSGNNLTIAASGGGGGAVTSVNGKTGAVVLTHTDVGAAPVASPAFTGIPTAPTAAKGTSTTQLATTAFVMANAGGGAVTSVNGKTGAVTLNYADVGAGGLAVNNTWTKTQLFQAIQKDASAMSVYYSSYSSGLTPTSCQVGFSGVGLSASSTSVVGYHNASNTNINIQNKDMSFSTQAGGDAYKAGGGTWAVASDARLKTNVQGLSGCLALLKGLEPVKYERTYEKGVEEVGFIANEVEKVLPTAVQEMKPEHVYDEHGEIVPTYWDKIIEEVGDDATIKTISWKNDFFAYLVGGIKELAELVSLQQIEIEALKEKIK